jgi:hypothetical protein
MGSDGDLVLTVESWRGPRTWRRVGLVDHVTRDGRNVALIEWEGTCAVCGRPFRLTTPQGVASADKSKSFQTSTCPAHRLTPSEAAKIRFAPNPLRAEIFDGIKREKLADTS